MKRKIKYSGIISSLILLVFLMSSYSVENPPVDREFNPKVTQKSQKRNLRLKTRQYKLEKRLKNTKNKKQRYRLKKKIRNIKQKQQTNNNPVFGITGFVLSLLAIIVFIAWLFALLFSLVYSYTVFSVLFLLFTSLGTAFTGLVLSIVGLVLSSKKPNIFSARGLSTAGMIIASVILAIILLAGLLFFLFL